MKIVIKYDKNININLENIDIVMIFHEYHYLLHYKLFSYCSLSFLFFFKFIIYKKNTEYNINTLNIYNYILEFIL